MTITFTMLSGQRVLSPLDKKTIKDLVKQITKDQDGFVTIEDESGTTLINIRNVETIVIADTPDAKE